MPLRQVSFAVALLIASASITCAKVIGTNPPALPLTAERIAQLPADQQTPWRSYLERSQKAQAEDRQSLAIELKQIGRTETTPAPKGHNAGLPLDNTANWYGGHEAMRIAEIVLTYQLPSGGWSKNLSMTREPRPPGGSYSGDVISRNLSKDDNDADLMNGWSYIGTFDNDATTTQLRFLAKVITKLDPAKSERLQAAFARGMGFIFAAQYPNGGFPQVWPLMGGYHDMITFNDGAMIHIVEMLEGVADGTADFAWVPASTRAQAGKSAARAIDCMLACQIRVNGQKKAWCQQNDMLTLAPASARNYEMPSVSAGESAEMTLFLMSRKNPTPAMVDAVNCAVAWYKKAALHGVAFVRQTDGRKLVSAPAGSPALWARYYDISNDRPLFGDRDKSIHDDVNEISEERRNGYAWFSTSGNRVLEHYPKWHAQQ